MTEGATAIKQRKNPTRTQESIFMVGKWTGGTFAACDKQPEENITQFNDIVAWAKKNLPTGSYEFIRKIVGPGTTLTIGSKTVTEAKLT